MDASQKEGLDNAQCCPQVGQKGKSKRRSCWLAPATATTLPCSLSNSQLWSTPPKPVGSPSLIQLPKPSLPCLPLSMPTNPSNSPPTMVQHLAHWLGICSLLKLTSTFVKFNFSLNTLLYHDKHRCLLDGGTPPMEPCQTHPLLIQKPLPNSKLKCLSKKLSNIILRYCWTQGDNTLSTFPCC